jgi:uncharacterized protein YbjQ (UPF0145 family)
MIGIGYARKQAFERMLKNARDMGADAIISFRYEATEFLPGATEVLAYGTAVRLSQTALKTSLPVEST